MQTTEWRYSPLHNTASIVLIGAFNPVIFQPRWLRSVDIISKDEQEEAVDNGVEVIHHEIVRFRLSWMAFQAEPQRLGIQFVEEPFIRALDMVTAMFTYLSHTPIRQFGVNRRVEFSFHTIKGWHAFGDRLAPKNHWASLLQDNARSRAGGLASLTMKRTSRSDGEKGFTAVTVTAGVEQACMIDINDHFDVSVETEAISASPAVNKLQERWNETQLRAEEIVQALMAIASIEDK